MGSTYATERPELVSEDALKDWRRFSDPGAIEFCERRGLSECVQSCLSIAHRVMGITKQPFALLVTDEEAGDASLMLFVTVSGNAEAASAAYEKFLHDWVAA